MSISVSAFPCKDFCLFKFISFLCLYCSLCITLFPTGHRLEDYYSVLTLGVCFGEAKERADRDRSQSHATGAMYGIVR